MRFLLLAVALLSSPAAAQNRAIASDPPVDKAHPASMQVLHIPSGGVAINGVAYRPAGAGLHPVLVLLHGLPGNEKNLDLAQAARRAGWIAVTFNYRGSWGSPGRFSFAHVLADSAAVLAFLRDPAQAARLGADPARIVLAGHSMGGWATLLTAARDHALAGAIAISAADLGMFAGQPRAEVTAFMADNAETLATTPATMADEAIANGPAMRLGTAAPGLARTPLLVLTSDDGLAPAADALVATVRREGNSRVATLHAATDHGWSDHRIALESAILDWLDALR
ncbi:alpha/beta hydrolase family protein [uncultured Sphingomonas sp.]|uniref:alpha/beta hydrolase family protein n=1 Tax=uncultured Sphingomonas sp. TaxID=158754 RepID=UPI0035CB56BE